MHNQHKYLVNGTITETQNLPDPFCNRGFLYADGFFETIRIHSSSMPLFNLHHGRIIDSLEAYKMKLPSSLHLNPFLNSLTDLYKYSGLENDARIRVTIFRGGTGRFSPVHNTANWIASIEPLADVGFKLNKKGVEIGLFRELNKSNDIFSNLKNINSQLSIQASLYANEHGFNDVLIQNTSGQIIESTNSNLFLVSNGALYTPKLESGPVGGVMRATIINLALELGIKIYECNLTAQELLKAEEVFLTNAINGIRWVSGYKNKRYFNKTSVMLLEAFMKNISLSQEPI